MRAIRWMISWLFFRFCYKHHELSRYIVAHWLPGVMRKLDGTRINGDYYIAEINRITGEQKPLIDLRIHPRDNGEKSE